jgi:glutamyl-tRNA reductase
MYDRRIFVFLEVFMNLFVLGVNYEVASAEIREKFFFSDDKILDEKELIKSCGVEEFIFLQTCNRNEIYLLMRDEKSIEDIKKYYLKNLSDREKSCVFIKRDFDFIEHIYMVSCGLNSAILGEGEILGQVKNALEFSIENGTSGKILNKIFREAITFSKRIRNEYKISENQTSVGAIASNFALEKLKESVRKNILIVGSGEVAKLIIKYLKDIDDIGVYITNRTRENA